MTTIKILPEILFNQIAAGEVVERPAAVVKELVENSIDAKSTEISIEIIHGGRSLIRVSDNGIGLSRDDALLSIERYATSKIFTNKDLFCISTMGFRGEALPSIASVSRFSLVTRAKDFDVGTKIDISGGKLINVSDTGAPVGTMVEVKNLFFNTPARKKFLKSDSTEISHIADIISGIALGNTHIRFRLFVNKKLYKNFSVISDLFQRAFSILGKEVKNKLYPIKSSDEYIDIKGFAAHPLINRSSFSKIFLFVNNRLIHDRGLISAIFQGYKGRIMKGKYPLAIIFIKIAFDEVDINVHPSKKQIKFFNSQRVYQKVAKAVSIALFEAQYDMDYSLKPQTNKLLSTNRFIDEEFIPKPFDQKGKPQDYLSNKTSYDKISEKSQDMTQENLSLWQNKNWQSSVNESKSFEKSFEDNFKIFEDINIIGQILGTYIVAQTKDNMLLIDQHAAHERIVYEKLKRNYESSATQSQELLVSQTFELSFKEADTLSQILDDLKSAGIIIEPFGRTSFIIKAVPLILDGKDIEPVIINIIENIQTQKTSFFKKNWLEKILILIACHNSIRAKLSLKSLQTQQLIKDLEKCENPFHCPHGRPIVVTFNKDQIKRFFKRT